MAGGPVMLAGMGNAALGAIALGIDLALLPAACQLMNRMELLC